MIAAPHFCLRWQLIVKAKRKPVRRWIVSQFGQFFSQLPKLKGSVFRCTVVCVLQWIEILQVGTGLNAGVSCRAVLSACTSTVKSLAESTAKPGRGCALAGAGQLNLVTCLVLTAGSQLAGLQQALLGCSQRSTEQQIGLRSGEENPKVLHYLFISFSPCPLALQQML